MLRMVVLTMVVCCLVFFLTPFSAAVEIECYDHWDHTFKCYHSEKNEQHLWPTFIGIGPAKSGSSSMHRAVASNQKLTLHCVPWDRLLLAEVLPVRLRIAHYLIATQNLRQNSRGGALERAVRWQLSLRPLSVWPLPPSRLWYCRLPKGIVPSCGRILCRCHKA